MNYQVAERETVGRKREKEEGGGEKKEKEKKKKGNSALINTQIFTVKHFQHNFEFCYVGK